MPLVPPSTSLSTVRYEIRGQLARRAVELEQAGKQIIKLNIGNPGIFGFRTPEVMRRAMIEHLDDADAYSHQKGIAPARAAVVQQFHGRGVTNVTVDDVYMGNGVSELILNALRGLLNPGDEVLVPSPDYPLWTAAVNLNAGKAVHYPCPEAKGFQPDVAALEQLITPRTRALVIINPNNPTGAVYPRATLEAMVRLAEARGLVVFSDEIYDQITYDGALHVPLATLVSKTLCATFGGLSKVYRACGWRVGWMVFSGDRSGASDYLMELDKLASLRLCSNVPGQWAVPAALGSDQSIQELVKPGGRLYQTRQAIIAGLSASKHLDAVTPQGAIYAFVRVKTANAAFSDQQFALDLLERKQVLVTPGRGFNVPYADHFRITLLPDERIMGEVFGRIEDLLNQR